jgi:general secretion pathway protein K
VNAPVSAQRGVALIVALLVVALAAVLIAGLLDRGELTLARTRNQLRAAQAQSYALGLEAYAAKVLMQDQAAGNRPDTPDSPWAVPLPPTPVPGGTIAAQMSDLNGKFNLNNLDPHYDTGGVWRAKFTLLLQALKLDPKLAGDVVAWINGAPAPGVADDGYYLGQPVPYRAARRPFAHVSELRLVRGVDGDTYMRLAPHLCALPQGTPINVNTASVPVLMTLAPNMTAEMAQAIWQQGHAHFRSREDMRSAQPGLRAIVCDVCYDVHSSYFLARGQITLDGLPLEFASTLERRIGGTNGGVRVLQRARATD